jgi:cell division transport system permease protein
MDVRDARRLSTALRSGLRGVWATPFVFAISVGTMAAGLLMLALYMLVVHNMHGALEGVSRELRMVVFLEGANGGDAGSEGAASEGGGRAELEPLLAGIAGLASVEFVSPDDALRKLRFELGRDADLLDGLPRNPLPASFELGVLPSHRTPERLRALAGAIEGLPGVAEVRYGADWAESYARVIGILEVVGLTLGGFLLLVLGAIVAGTVRLAVHSRADEIEIQRLVGAGGLFVRLPFYLEGALQGGAAAALALAVLYGLYRLGLPMLREPLEFLVGRAELVFFGPLEVALLFGVALALGIGAAVVALMRLEAAP